MDEETWSKSESINELRHCFIKAYKEFIEEVEVSPSFHDALFGEQ